MGIEPTYLAWKASVLPLNYTRTEFVIGQMPATGIEPVREYKSRRILSPVRLPVPPRRHILKG